VGPPALVARRQTWLTLVAEGRVRADETHRVPTRRLCLSSTRRDQGPLSREGADCDGGEWESRHEQWTGAQGSERPSEGLSNPRRGNSVTYGAHGNR